MPSDLAETLFARLIESFPPRRAYGPAAFEREPMPSPVAYFLRHWLRYRLRHETSGVTIPTSDWFDPDAAQRARQELIDTLIEHGHFPAATWEASLREAVKQVTAYLIRPASALTAFIYQENKQAVPVKILDWRLGYFEAYPYFHKTARLYITEQEVDAVEQGPFTEVLYGIDRKITKEYDTAAWLDLLAPLMDLTRRAGIGDGVPIALLLAFFEEKNATEIVDRLSKHQQQHGVQALDEDGLRLVLDDAPEPEPVSAPPMPPTAPEPEPGPVPRWKQFQRQQPTASRTPAPKPPLQRPPRRSPLHTPDEAQPNPFAQARPRWMQFQQNDQPEAPATTLDPPAPPAGTNLAEIEHAVLGEAGLAHRALFIKALFNESLETYERVLRQLHATPSWPEASQIIAADVFRPFHVNIYSNPAILFTDAVEASYLEREA